MRDSAPLFRAIAALGRRIEAAPAMLPGPKAPPPAPAPTPMPDLSDPAILAAKSQAMQAAAASSGRMSTILSAGGGGNNYSGQKTGAA